MINLLNITWNKYMAAPVLAYALRNNKRSILKIISSITSNDYLNWYPL